MFETTVLKIGSPDGQSELEVARLPTGMYQFTEWTKQAGDESTGPCTALTHLSGLYETQEAAETDARQILPWFRDISK
ncbi:hypothetical protein [Flavisphingomonas formosensis]|uniref:hypothetical protein n=1 Tax=Flavisphingomonas formosensis TaxID=861534 RepID=UPI0012FA1DCB|nr:hypothetical protein [Sphingomonas formosensis]